MQERAAEVYAFQALRHVSESLHREKLTELSSVTPIGLYPACKVENGLVLRQYGVSPREVTAEHVHKYQYLGKNRNTHSQQQLLSF